MNKPSRFLWLDTEHTGTDPRIQHRVLEIGAVVTTGELEEVGSFQTFVHATPSVMKYLFDQNPWWAEQHEVKARLIEHAPTAPQSSIVDGALEGFMFEHFGEDKIMLCGNSVGYDHAHIRGQFPLSARHLHHRVIDISSLSELAKIYRGTVEPRKSYPHEALADVRESIEQARYLFKLLGFLPITTECQ